MLSLLSSTAQHSMRPDVDNTRTALQTYCVSRQHRRAVLLLKHHGLMEDMRFRYLAAKCLAEVEEWDECLTMLGDGELDDDMQDSVRATGQAGRHTTCEVLGSTRSTGAAVVPCGQACQPLACQAS